VIEVAAAVALTTLLLGVAGALVVSRLRSVRGRLAGLALVASVAPMVGLLGSGVLMFESGHDLLLAAIAAAASSGALVGAWLVARSVAGPLGSLGSTAIAMGHGDLARRAPDTGPNEIRELAAAFNAMAADIESLFDARRELVAWASHDLRTPLAALQALVEAAEDGVVDAARVLPQMAERIGAMTALVDDLLVLAMLGTTAARTGDDRLDAVAAVRRAADASTPVAAARGVTIELVAPERAAALASERRLDRVLGNVLDNATRHAHGTVVVTVRVGEQVEIAIDDDGVGLAAGELERAFEPFWRADPSRTDGGAGLGLAIARGLVAADGGSVVLGRSAAGGLCATIRLPRSGATEQAADAAAVPVVAGDEQLAER
jgi:two-component system sensor histidine kinase BaeS